MKGANRRAARWAGYAATLGLVGLVVYGAAVYALGGMPFLVVADSPSSMSSTINHGDLTVNYVVPFDDLKVGDIVAFHDPRGNPVTVVHRVVAVDTCGAQKCLVTKGDNSATNPTPDPWRVTQADYLGKVELVIPYVGYLSPALWGSEGALMLMPLGAAALLAVTIGVVKQVRPNDTEVNS